MGTCKCSIRMENVTVRKRDGVLLNKVNLEVHHAEIMALIGRNGAGKTTLLKALLGRIRYEGRIFFTDPNGAQVKQPRIGYVPQNMVFDRSTPMTAGDMLCANLDSYPVWLGHKREKTERAAALLQKVGAGPDILKKQLGSLSGGEMQRVLLAFALEPMPDLLLLDEPVSAVDRRGIELFYDLVTSLRSEFHMPVILVSHDLSHVQKYATGAALLDRSILIRGPVDKVLASPQVKEAFGLPDHF